MILILDKFFFLFSDLTDFISIGIYVAFIQFQNLSTYVAKKGSRKKMGVMTDPRRFIFLEQPWVSSVPLRVGFQ